MSTKQRWLLAGILTLALVLAIFLVPHLAKRFDAAFDRAWEKSAALEAQYRDMTNTYALASELQPDHPTAVHWRERKTALMESGYIETRELQLRHNLGGKGAVVKFFTAFRARFPGVECSVRNIKDDAPLVTVIARPSDFGPFGPIELFLNHYDPAK